jgi:hypothetical protein
LWGNSEGGIFADNCELNVFFSTIARNGETGTGNQAGFNLTNTTLTLENSIVANNPTGVHITGGALFTKYSLVTGVLGSIIQNSAEEISLGIGTLEDEPRFTSPLAGDFSLSEYSPTIGPGQPHPCPCS